MTRLLDLQSAAEYLGISPDAMRVYISKEVVVPVLLPPCRGKNPMRKVLIDRGDLDKLIDAQKHGKRLPSRTDLVDQVLPDQRPATDPGIKREPGQRRGGQAIKDPRRQGSIRPSGEEWKRHVFASNK